MTEISKQKVPFTDVVSTIMEIIIGAVVSCLILSVVFKMDMKKPGKFNSALIGSTIGFFASNTKRAKKDD